MSVFSFPLLIRSLMIQGKGYKSNLNEVGKSTFDGLASTNLGWICLKMFGGDFQGGWNLERNYSNKRKYCIKTFWFFLTVNLYVQCTLTFQIQEMPLQISLVIYLIWRNWFFPKCSECLFSLSIVSCHTAKFRKNPYSGVRDIRLHDVGLNWAKLTPFAPN